MVSGPPLLKIERTSTEAGTRRRRREGVCDPASRKGRFQGGVKGTVGGWVQPPPLPPGPVVLGFWSKLIGAKGARGNF